MNIYKISQVYNGYDTYDSAVVIAETEEAARNTHPSKDDTDWFLSTWNSPENITVELIGMAKSFSVAGVVCASFNAG